MLISEAVIHLGLWPRRWITPPLDLYKSSYQAQPHLIVKCALIMYM